MQVSVHAMNYKNMDAMDMVEANMPILSMVEDGATFKEGIELNYAFHTGWYSQNNPQLGFEVLEDGSYKSEHDAPLKPMITVEGENELLHIYPYAIVVYIGADGEAFWTRID